MNQLPLSLPMQKPIGTQRLERVLQYLQDNPINDIVVKGPDISFLAISSQPDHAPRLRLIYNSNTSATLTVHPHALGQLCGRVRVPRAYVQGLIDEGQLWAIHLAIQSLNELYQHRGYDKKYLLRSVKGQLRGMLSNAYKCLDSVTLINTFARHAATVGAMPYDAFITDLRVAVQAALPQTYKVNGDDARVGVLLRNSDYGAGLAEVRFFLSVNGLSMISQKGIKRAHRGRRLREDQGFNERIRLEDSDRIAEEMKSHIIGHLEPGTIAAVMAEVELSASVDVNVEKVEDLLKTLELTDAEIDLAAAAFRTRPDLPAGHSLYRLANAIAWIASESIDPERKLDLMDTAGGLIMKA